jgi:hypothetical protein
MKPILLLPIIFALFSTFALAQTELQRYDYQISGKVLDKKS